MKLKFEYQCSPCQSNMRKRHVGEYFHCDYTVRIGGPRHFACPNPNFIAKHTTDRNPDSVEGAQYFANQADFTRLHSPVARTNLNSVFIRNWFAYEMENGFCKFSYPATKYNCNPSGQWAWTCTRQGIFYAYHDPYSGHYDPLMDIQVPEHDELKRRH